MKKLLKTAAKGVITTMLTLGGGNASIKQEHVNPQGIAQASNYAMNIGFNEAQARTQFSDSIPMALQLSPDKALPFAWEFLVNRHKYNDRVNGQNVLRLVNSVAQDMYIDEKTPLFSPTYHLLLKRAGNVHNSDWVQENIANKDNWELLHYIEGLRYFFSKKGREVEAKLSFAKGMFHAARLTLDDYNTMQDARLGIAYDEKTGAKENIEILAIKFVQLPVDKQNWIADNIILPKFKDLKITGELCYDLNSKEYNARMVYWNWGFFMQSEHFINSDNVKKILENKKGLYYNVGNKLNYDSLDNNLINSS